MCMRKRLELILWNRGLNELFRLVLEFEFVFGVGSGSSTGRQRGLRHSTAGSRLMLKLVACMHLNGLLNSRFQNMKGLSHEWWGYCLLLKLLMFMMQGGLQL